MTPAYLEGKSTSIRLTPVCRATLLHCCAVCACTRHNTASRTKQPRMYPGWTRRPGWPLLRVRGSPVHVRFADESYFAGDGEASRDEASRGCDAAWSARAPHTRAAASGPHESAHTGQRERHRRRYRWRGRGGAVLRQAPARGATATPSTAGDASREKTCLANPVREWLAAGGSVVRAAGGGGGGGRPRPYAQDGRSKPAHRLSNATPSSAGELACAVDVCSYSGSRGHIAVTASLQ